MYRVAFGLIACLIATSASAGETTAEQIIKQAVKAAGGAKAIAAPKMITFDEKGTYYGMGDGLAYTGKYAIAFPRRSRMEIVGFFLMVVDDDKGWVSQTGQTSEMNATQLKEQHVQFYVSSLTSLAPFAMGGKGLKLTKVDGAKVKGKQTVGVKVSKKGMPDVTLSFDAKTNLLARADYKATSVELGGKEVSYSTSFAEYKTVGGVKSPTKMNMLRDGKKFVEATVQNMKLHDKADDKLFAQPK